MEPMYIHVAAHVLNSLWAVTPELREIMADVLAQRMAGDRLDAAEIEARIGAAQPAKVQRVRAGNVAIVPVHGMLTQRASLFSQVSGMTSLEQVAAQYDDALNDAKVDTVVLHMNTPGGSTDGIPELAARIRAGRDHKRIVAVADTLSASGGYWLGSQAHEFSVTMSGSAGSIGVYSLHRDLSKRLEQDGVDVTMFSAGDFKTEGNPFGPLSDDAKEAIQERVNDMYDLFVDDVAAGRGVASDSVRGGFGRGRTLNARRALEAGMVDRIETFDQALARHRTAPPPRRQPSPPPDRAVARRQTARARQSAGLLLSALPRSRG
ncbi:MAG: S49 family peptidase [Pseudomonadota bacterium]